MSEAGWTLAQTQSWLQAALIDPAQGEKSLPQILCDSSKLEADRRLAIYQRSYHARLLKCMEQQFPALRYALGDALYADFAGEYLRQCPPNTYTLGALGARFPAYLEAQRPDRAQPAEQREDWIDFMVDLATLEWEVFRLFDAPGLEGSPRSTYASDATADSQLIPQSCLALRQFRYPVAEYYGHVRRQAEPDFPLPRQSSYVLVRRDYLTQMINLQPAHYLFLRALINGLAVEQALNEVAALIARPIAEVIAGWRAVGGIRSRWIAAGIFAARAAQ